MYHALTPAHWLTLHGLVTSLAILTYAVSSHVTQQRRQPSAAIAWILFILLLPYLAMPAYLLFGTRKLVRPHHGTAVGQAPVCGRGTWAVETILSLGQPAPASYADLRIHADGHQARKALMDTINAADSTIDLCTFILGRDELGQAVVDRLVDKARTGVRVRLLIDGVGSWMQGQPDVSQLIGSGGEVALFAPPLRSPLKGRTNLRNHRKLLIADAGLPTARLWCGGRNLAAEYFEGTPAQPPWRDLSFELGGPLVDQASALFEHDWNFAKGLPQFQGPSKQNAIAAPLPSIEGAQLIASGPDQADDTLLALLVTAAYRARQRIGLATPYFVPDPALLMALCLAARRGVAVDLLLPARSNHRLSDWARGRALRSLTEAGGRVWLAPGMMHAKLALFDDEIALAGSANLDSRSLLLNYELMVAFHEASDAQRFAGWFALELRSAVPYIVIRPGLIRDVTEGMLLWLGFQL